MKCTISCEILSELCREDSRRTRTAAISIPSVQKAVFRVYLLREYYLYYYYNTQKRYFFTLRLV